MADSDPTNALTFADPRARTQQWGLLVKVVSLEDHSDEISAIDASSASHSVCAVTAEAMYSPGSGDNPATMRARTGASSECYKMRQLRNPARPLL
jgi:hypothetical protein